MSDRGRHIACQAVAWALGTMMLAAASGADWPTHRADQARSGVVAEEVALPLEEVWVHEPGAPPCPAWPELPAKQDVWHRLPWLSPTVTYDRAFQVAVAGGRVFFGSSADDTVYCLEAATGKVCWSFATEGPIRLAPTVADRRVYVGSDDGCLYCLTAAEGTLLWRYRAGPEDRRLPGNGRIISLWPVRCGVVVDSGAVYFCAGLFPCQGVYLVALDAQTGKPLWKQPINESAQGFLLASATRLFVPTGRTAPHAYGRSAGEDLGRIPGGGVDSRAGGTFALLADDMLIHAAGEDGKIHFSKANAPERIVSAAGLRLLVHGSTSYILTQNRLLAVDRAAYIELGRLEAKKQRSPEEQRRFEQLSGPPKGYLKWDVPCANPYELIMAGGAIFAGGEDRVVAYRAADGKKLWTGPVSGKAYGLAASGGRLLVSTDTGAIYCFGPRSGRLADQVGHETTKHAASPYPVDSHTPLYEQAAQRILEVADTRQGYCLVLGAGEGRLAYEIAKRSQFHVIGLEADPAKAAAARKLLREAGLCGTRISIHAGTLDQVRYQPYFANLITSEEALSTGRLPPAREVYRLLRPCGGTVAFVCASGAAAEHTLKQWGAGVISGWHSERTADGLWIGAARRGSLPGAGHWSHLYADAGNTACSQDQLVQGPVSIQWFGRPGPQHMVDRHDKNTGPVYANGRLFVSGDNYIFAIDAYNGTILWERAVPESVRLGALRNCGNMAAADDCLYVAAGNQCLALDAQTGQQRFAVPVQGPSPGGKEWGYVAVVDDILLGSQTKGFASFRYQTLDTEVLIWRDRMPVVCSESLFALDRQTGKKRWDYTPGQGVIINPTIAAGGGRVYFIESANPETREVADGRIKLDALLGRGANLVALDLRTGVKLYSKPAPLEQLQHIIFLSYTQETLLVTGTKNVLVEGKGRVRYDLAAFDAATGDLRWQNTQTPIPDHILQGPHGEQVQHSAIVGGTIYNTGFACELRTGEGVPGWKWQKSGNCGTLTTSAFCAFSRYSNARMFNLRTGNYTDLTTVIRPGCWVNIIPAGGLIMIPEQSAGCICGYPIQTSIALLPESSERLTLPAARGAPQTH